MIDITVLRASGLNDAQILKVLETEQAELRAKVREQNRIRQRNQRTRNAVTRDHRDVRDAVDNKEGPHTPIETTTSEGSREPSSAADAASPAPVYTDSRHELWGEGIPILAQLGVKDRTARSNIGRWLKAAHDDAHTVLGAIQRARDNRVIDPIPWISQAISTPASRTNGHHRQGLKSAGDELFQEALDLERAAGDGRPDDDLGSYRGGVTIDGTVAQRKAG